MVTRDGMFTRIMVPLDGSDLAEQALPYAGYLAASTGGTLYLLYALEPPSAIRAQGLGAPVNVYEPIIAAQRQEATAYLEQMRARMEGEGRSVHVELLDGHAAAVLLDYVREAGIDLVVMTTHGHAGLTRWSLGSVANRVAGAGTVAVLLVPVRAAGQTERA